MPTQPTSTAPPLAPRVALLSIGCFWTFYFLIWSLRGVVLYHHQTSMLGIRAIVSLFSAGVTVVFYLLMRRIAATSVPRSIATALILALPAATLYASFNWYMFDYIGHAQIQGSRSPKGPSASAPGQRLPSAAAPVSVGAMPANPDDTMTPVQAIADQAGNGYFFFIAWAALYLALGYAAAVGALERRTAGLRAAAQAAELRALRYQVNPHFLFNTLNSLSSLVMSGKREEAERMIINLSTFFRTSLTGDPTEDVPLSEEIRLQRLYLDIERVRFPDRLLVAFDMPETLLTACIPGLILQPLVENAVKYAVSRARRPVTIRIAAREAGGTLSLTVEDDGDPGETVAAGTGVGLRNVSDRLVARFGYAGACHWLARPGGGFAVNLTMPLVRDAC